MNDRRARKKAAVRGRIISAAIELFPEHGIDGVTVEQIADEADVGKGTIYNYFQTKEDIVVAFMVDFERKVQDQVDAIEDESTSSLAELLSKFLLTQFRLKEPHYRFVRVFLGQMFLRTEQFLPYMAEIHATMRPRIDGLLVRLKQRGLLRTDVDLAEVATTLSSIQLGLTAMWAIEGPPFKGTRVALEQEMKLLCEGLEAR